MTRLTVRIAILAALVASSSLRAGAVERALLVGIDKYDAPAPGIARSMPELYGPANDVQSIRDVLKRHLQFVDRAGASDSGIVVLPNVGQEATRENILAQLRLLVQESHTGDVLLFYFAGHGSYTPSLSGSGMDQTIVPVDAAQGVPDIRSKTIAKILMEAVSRGALVTAIFDSCYSGSIARSVDSRVVRTAEPQEPSQILQRYRAEDADDAHYTGDRPEDRGALILSAALSDQEAQEGLGETDGLQHGVFTMNLIDVLASSDPNAPIADLFRKVQTRVQADVDGQTPVMAGQSRFDKPLLGVGAAEYPKLYVTVVGRSDADYIVDAGSAAGLYPGTLMSSDMTTGGNSVTLQVKQVIGVDRSVASVVGKDPNIKVKDRVELVVQRWVLPSQAMLRVSIPAALQTPAIQRMAAVVASLRANPAIDWVSDPTASSEPGAIRTIRWNGGQWECVPAGGAAIELGADPAASAILDAVTQGATAGRKPALYVDLPPSLGLASQIKLGSNTDNNVVDLVQNASDADYRLCGRIDGSSIEYAWVRQGATRPIVDDPHFSDSAFAAPSAAGSPASQLAPRSDWVGLADSSAASLGQALTNTALILAKVKSWLLLDPPVGSNPFPYSIALKEVQTGAYRDSMTATDVHPGEQYKIIVRALTGLPAKVPRRYVYVFDINAGDYGQLLYPVDPGRADSNLLPLDENSPSTDIDLGLPAIPVTDMAGADTLLMLTSDRPVDDPSVFSWQGVQAQKRSAGDWLQNLLDNVGNTSRSPSSIGSADSWSVSRVTISTVTTGSNDTK